MGCGTPESSKKTTVPIGNNFVHLLQTEQVELIRKKLQAQGNEMINCPLNFRGDTAAHFACYKNNIKLVQLLIEYGADFWMKNQAGQSPADLATNTQIIKLIGGKKVAEPTITTAHQPNPEPTAQQKKSQPVASISTLNQSSDINYKIKKTNANRHQLLRAIQMEEPNNKQTKKQRIFSDLTLIAKSNIQNRAHMGH